MIPYEQRPHRPCVGLMVVNREGLVFIGKREGGPEHVDARHAWQMPQGGIDEGEDPHKAALRELYEETNIRSVERLGETRDWLAYDLSPEVADEAWGGRYRGQKQKWFALRFVGEDDEIDIAAPGGGGRTPEFSAWRWERLDRVPALVIPFKRAVYERVIEELGRFAAP